jgi:uncharacterized protein YdbL (DUF1318 family)
MTAHKIVESLLGESRPITVQGRTGETFTVAIGDIVGFKMDVEQYAKVKDIRVGRRNTYQVLVDVTAGEYGRGPMWLDVDQLWKDDV